MKIAMTRQQSRTKARESILSFAKMQALGNDFVVVGQEELTASKLGAELFSGWPEQAAFVAQALCDRHYGVGADGLIVVISPGRDGCELSWSYTNGDGSPSPMCGNGLRCLALWAYQRELVVSRQFRVSTATGPVAVSLADCDQITTELGEPILDSQRIPISGEPRGEVVREPLTAGGQVFAATCVSIGNPHCVIFEPAVSEADYAHYAPRIQSLSAFPEGVNVEFARIVTGQHARVYVWERGCGPTLACASGAAAVLVAGVLEGRLSRESTIELPGGCLQVAWSDQDNKVRLTGPARETYRGQLDLGRLLAEATRR